MNADRTTTPPAPRPPCSRQVPVGPSGLGRGIAAVIAAGIAGGASLMFVAPAAAADFTVTSSADSGTGSLRQALLDAEAAAGADTVTIGALGTITLLSPLPQVTQELVVTGPGAAQLAVSGGGATGLFSVTGGDLTLSDLTIQAAAGSAAVAVDDGSLLLSDVTMTGNTARAVAAAYSDLTIEDSTLSGNTGSQGGAVFAYYGTLAIRDSTLSGNTAVDEGGAVYSDYASVEISGTTISGNTAGDEGGGVWSDDVEGFSLVSSVVSDNTAEGSQGGGVYLDEARATTISDTTFAGNQAAGSGGGLYVQMDDGPESDQDVLSPLEVSVTGVTAVGNTAPEAGGLDLNTGEGVTLLVNSTVTGNTGGGIRAEQYSYTDEGDAGIGNVTVEHVTVTDNTGGPGLDATELAALAVTDTVLANPGETDLVTDPEGTATVGHSLLLASTTVVDGTDGNVVGEDPLLGALADNGGPTRTQLPGTGSPVIDAGTPGEASTTADQRGLARVADGDADGTAVTDMGAVEVQPAVAPPVDPPVVEPVAPVVTTPAAPTTPVAAGPQLANTGADTGVLLPAGVGLLGLGGLLTALTARRRVRRQG